MEQFASGPKRSYYGKGDVIAYRLKRDADGAERAVFGANVTILIYGDAFWPTYTTGDNTGVVATDSMKNFVQRETLLFEGERLESYAQFLASRFLAKYGQVEGIRLSAMEIPYSPVGTGGAFAPAGPDRASVDLELSRTGWMDLVSGIRGFRLLRLSGSAFRGFVRDEYTTLPDLDDRPLHMWLDLQWRYVDPLAASTDSDLSGRVRSLVVDLFERFESGSIQQLIHAIGTSLLARMPEMAEVMLEANNRTWDGVTERGSVGIFTEPRPPYGCLGLRLTR